RRHIRQRPPIGESHRLRVHSCIPRYPEISELPHTTDVDDVVRFQVPMDQLVRIKFGEAFGDLADDSNCVFLVQAILGYLKPTRTEFHDDVELVLVEEVVECADEVSGVFIAEPFSDLDLPGSGSDIRLSLPRKQDLDRNLRVIVSTAATYDTERPSAELRSEVHDPAATPLAFELELVTCH